MLDANLRPILNHKGIVSKNSHGEWNIMCGDTINLIENGAETAGQVCSILGFRYFDFNKNVFQLLNLLDSTVAIVTLT